jgi:Transcriptional regulator
MYIKPQQYIIALAEEKSITKAAKRLGISQPALTNWLNSIENELNLKLVIRSKKELLLTPAGKIYLEGSRKIVNIKQNTFAQIAGIAENFHETIYVGVTPQRGSFIISDIFSDFQQKFPKVSLRTIESYNDTLMDYLMTGKINLCLIGFYDIDNPNIDYINLKTEEIVLVVPNNHKLAYDSSNMNANSKLPYINLALLKDTPFIMQGPHTSSYKNVNRMFRNAGINPNIIYETDNIHAIYHMVKKGCGFAFVPKLYVSPLDNVSAFSLNPALNYNLGIAYKKGRILTEAEQYLISLISRKSNSKSRPIINNEFKFTRGI